MSDDFTGVKAYPIGWDVVALWAEIERLRQKLDDCEKLRDSWMEQAQIWQQKHAVAVTVADTQIRLAKRAKAEGLEKAARLMEQIEAPGPSLAAAAIRALKEKPPPEDESLTTIRQRTDTATTVRS